MVFDFKTEVGDGGVTVLVVEHFRVVRYSVKGLLRGRRVEG